MFILIITDVKINFLPRTYYPKYPYHSVTNFSWHEVLLITNLIYSVFFVFIFLPVIYICILRYLFSTNFHLLDIIYCVDFFG